MSSGQADAQAGVGTGDRAGFAARAFGGLLAAIAFLTILPLPSRVARALPPDLSSAIPWFPVVGAAVGAAAGGTRVGLDPVLGPGPSTVLAMIVLVAVTGALHHDGLADAADGLGVRGDLARRLAVMRDSAIGAFGMLALVGWALLLFTALEPLSSGHALRALIAAGAASRLAIVVQAFGTASARPDGLGAAFQVSGGRLAVAATETVVIVLAVAGVAAGSVSLVAGVIAAVLMTLFVRCAFGGRTGDTLGAGAVIAELVVCLTLTAWWQ